MDDHLHDMALFVEVVKARGFRKAAAILGMPNSSLSRRITALEKAVGLRLLHRTTRNIEPTEAGQLYFERSKRIVNEARLVHEQLGEMLAQPSGVLRASFSVDFAVTYLAPIVAEFASLYPGLTFDFDLSSRRVDLVTEPFDVAIRMGDSEDSGLVARNITTLVPRLYAAPAYLARMGEPAEPADLSGHQCFHVLRGTHWRLYREGQTIEVPIGGRFQVNSIGMIRRLASLGMGVALLSDAVVADDVASGTLRRILPEWSGAPIPVYAVTETRLLPAKTQRFIDHVKLRMQGA